MGDIPAVADGGESRPLSSGLLASSISGDEAKSAILTLTMRRIGLFQAAGDDWRFAESLRSISEDTAQEYQGRAILELLQNGHDALHAGQPGRLAVLLDRRGRYPVLYVANEGSPFTEGNFRAITELALSDKDPGEGIGNKGLGFRSVLQLTDWPEIYSKTDASSPTFDGYCFRFATPDDLQGLLEDETEATRVGTQVSPLNLPVPAHVEDPVLAELAGDGFVTVVRLPLRDMAAIESAAQQAGALVNAEAPILLFLDRIASLRVEIRQTGGLPDVHELTRAERHSDLVPVQEREWVSEVDLGHEGQYLLARRPVPPEQLDAAIERSIAAREIDKRWRDWSGEPWIAIALRLDTQIPRGRLYTFLPMSTNATSPLCAHMHAPFFTKIARLDLDGSIALNDLLLDQGAELSLDLARRLRDEAPHDDAAGLVADLVSWEPVDRLVKAWGEQRNEEPIVPLVDTADWASLSELRVWPVRERPWAVLTHHNLARVGARLLDPALGPRRLERIGDLCKALRIPVVARTGEAAGWAEEVAAYFHSQEKSGLATETSWPDFYDDLEQAFRNQGAALHGKKIILDQDGVLTSAQDLAPASGRPGRVVFFSPEEEAERDGAPRIPSRLQALQRRISFTHPGIDWRGPVREFLVKNGLVREYRTERVLEALRELLATGASDALCRDVLVFAASQFPTLTQLQSTSLTRIAFRVPTIEGSWELASQSLFSPRWETDGARRFERFLAEGGSAAAGLAGQTRRWIAPPQGWPGEVQDLSVYRDFLRRIGVHDGLWISDVGTRLGSIVGSDLRPELIARRVGVEPRVAEAWAKDVHQEYSGAQHPWTQYEFVDPLVDLPGALDVLSLSVGARRQFAELILFGLHTWQSRQFSVTVRRPNRPTLHQDPHEWPTPLATFLRRMPWLPIEDGEGGPCTFVSPDQAWFNADGDLPTFVPSLSLSVRRLIADQAALGRLRELGLRLWDDPEHSGDAVRELGTLLAQGSVPDHLRVSFKKHYASAWSHAAGLAIWPWVEGEQVNLAVDGGAGLTVISVEQKIYVVDEDAALKESLVTLAGHPVLVTQPGDGQAVATLLEVHGVAVARLSQTEVHVLDGDRRITSSTGYPLLTDGRPWLTVVIALVMELKSGAFVRRSEQGNRAVLGRLRAVRVARVEHADVLIDQIRASPTRVIRSVPLPDRLHPTIVVWDVEGAWDELQSCAPALAQLLGQPALRDPLELTFMKLHKIFGEEPGATIDDEALALALDTTATRIGELRRSFAGNLADLIYHLRPVLVYAAGIGELEAIDETLARAGSDDGLAQAIEQWARLLDRDATALVATARQCRSLDEICDELDLDFGAFNTVLSVMGPAYGPILHPDAHELAFDEFLRAHARAIVDRLREHYRALAVRGDDVSDYVAARSLEGLSADTVWLNQYRIPSAQLMHARVTDWLRGHGANTDLDVPAALEPVEDVRADNHGRLETLVTSLQSVMPAWCRAHGSQVPAAWGTTALNDAKAILERCGLGDLLALSQSQLIDILAGSMGLPLDMPRTIDLAELGLSAVDLGSTAPSGLGAQREPSHTTISLGDVEVTVGRSNFPGIVTLASQSVDEGFLSQSGSVRLDTEIGAQVRRSMGAASSVNIVVRKSQMSEDQRGAVGLAGEVLARAWLERKYPEGVRWMSGYAAELGADPDASDSHGYDFEVLWRKRTLFHEVKALVSPPGAVVEFEMGESEVRAAQHYAKSNRYRILLISSALDPPNRRVYELPNPFSDKGRGTFRVVGCGLRYQFKPLD